MCSFIDTCGGFMFEKLNFSLIYSGIVQSCILIYDVTDTNSFNWCKKKLEELEEIFIFAKKGIKVYLIGNKIDLEDKRVVSKEDGYNLSLDYNLIYMETSCKYYYNVVNTFETILIETYNYLRTNNRFENEKINLYKK